ncbi:MAG: flagellar biosynthetic protein FliQ [Acidocella sp.]|nr:flagellar biosynthetic protein FliQ [Acidocella sp.]
MPLYVIWLHMALVTELAAITPIIAFLLIIGVVTAIIQSALQIEDATFSLLPKTIAMIAIGLFGGFGAMKGISQFAVMFIAHAAILVHQSWS